MSQLTFDNIPLNAVLHARSETRTKFVSYSSKGSELISAANALLSSTLESNDVTEIATSFNRSQLLLTRPTTTDLYTKQVPIGRLIFAAHLSAVMRSQIFSGLAREMHLQPVNAPAVAPIPNIAIRKRLPPSSSALAAAATAATLARSNAKEEIRSMLSIKQDESLSESALEQSLLEIIKSSESGLLSLINLRENESRDRLMRMLHLDRCAATLIPTDRSKLLVNELLNRHHLFASKKQQQQQNG